MRSTGLVGIDVGGHSIKAMALERDAAGRLALSGLGLARAPREKARHWEEEPQAAAEALGPLLRKLLEASGLGGRSHMVSVALSGPSLAVRNLAIPVVPANKLEAAVAAEAELRLPFSAREAYLSHHILDTSAETGLMDILAAAARKSLVEGCLAVLRAARLTPAVLDAAGLALYNAFDFSRPGQRVDGALLDIGAERLTLALMKKGRPVLVREEAGGGREITLALARHFNISMSEAEAVKLGSEAAPNSGEAAEIAADTAGRWLECLARAAGDAKRESGFSLESVHLSGGGALLTGLAQSFADHFLVPAELWSPLPSVARDAARFDPAYLEQVGPQMAVVFGLALRKAAAR